MDNNVSFLPLGSKVILTDDKPCIIIGFLKDNSQGIKFDYIGVENPYGYLGPSKIRYFNSNEIKNIEKKGYENTEEQLLFSTDITNIKLGNDIVENKEEDNNDEIQISMPVFTQINF